MGGGCPQTRISAEHPISITLSNGIHTILQVKLFIFKYEKNKINIAANLNMIFMKIEIEVRGNQLGTLTAILSLYKYHSLTFFRFNTIKICNKLTVIFFSTLIPINEKTLII